MRLPYLVLLVWAVAVCLGAPGASGQRLGAAGRSWSKPGDPCSPAPAASPGPSRTLEEACRLNPDAVWARARMPVQPPEGVPLAPPLPRIHVADLNRPENLGFKLRRRPFVLVGAMAEHADGTWSAMSELRLPRKQPADAPAPKVAQIWPQAVAEYYPWNMLVADARPYLVRLGSAVSDLLDPRSAGDPSKFERDQRRPDHSCGSGCRYIHMQLPPKHWAELERRRLLPVARDRQLEGDAWWTDRCLADPRLLEEFHLKTHWKMTLMGTRGSGMFNHTDSLLSASWHGHIQGRKWWYVCSTNEGFAASTEGFGSDSPDWWERGHPEFLASLREGRVSCWETVMYPGEVLYYGRAAWHATRNLDHPSSTFTGTVVTAGNYRQLAGQLRADCARDILRYQPSAELCSALDRCFQVWEQRFRPGSALVGRPAGAATTATATATAGDSADSARNEGARRGRRQRKWEAWLRAQVSQQPRASVSPGSLRETQREWERRRSAWRGSAGQRWLDRPLRIADWSLEARDEALLRSRRETRPEDNNYDGRNYIHE